MRTELRPEGGRGIRQVDIRYREQPKSMSNLSENEDSTVVGVGVSGRGWRD